MGSIRRAAGAGGGRQRAGSRAGERGASCHKGEPPGRRKAGLEPLRGFAPAPGARPGEAAVPTLSPVGLRTRVGASCASVVPKIHPWCHPAAQRGGFSRPTPPCKCLHRPENPPALLHLPRASPWMAGLAAGDLLSPGDRPQGTRTREARGWRSGSGGELSPARQGELPRGWWHDEKKIHIFWVGGSVRQTGTAGTLVSSRGWKAKRISRKM